MMAGLDWTADDRAFTYHGGALEVARRLAPQAPEPWIDLSTGVNPHAYPLPDLEPEAWSRLPEIGALAKLEAAAARRYGVAAASVVAGPGSQALIHALAHILARRTVGALTPTYGGFAAAFAAAGARVVEAKRLEGMDGLDVAIVVNPNNPDGRMVSRDDLLHLHDRLAAHGSVLIVDEAFADFELLALELTQGPSQRVSSPLVGEDQGEGSRRPSRQGSDSASDNLLGPRDPPPLPAPTRGGGGANVIDSAEMQQAQDPEESLAPRLPASGAVVLRSFGKAYGLAGLRLGFALASPDLVPSLRAALGSWPVSGPAIAIGIRALADSDWLAAMGARLGKEAARLDALLREAGCRIVGGTRLFRLAAHEDARGAFERLLAAGILARPFADERTWLRFGIPGDENAWERLAAALQS
jgi:histidinol-phosphate/aromatic aminotransferase/cobyric acid decarboxylase-like protein